MPVIYSQCSDKTKKKKLINATTGIKVTFIMCRTVHTVVEELLSIAILLLIVNRKNTFGKKIKCKYYDF